MKRDNHLFCPDLRVSTTLSLQERLIFMDNVQRFSLNVILSETTSYNFHL